MPVIILGSINTDLVVRVAHLPNPGETVLGGEFYCAGGGKGANQAVAAARAASQPVTFIASLGRDPYGEQALANFRQEGIATDFIKRSALPTGVALIMVDERGENMISVASGANLDLRPSDVDAVSDEAFRAAKVFLACLESPLDAVARGLARAKAAGLLTVLNPAPLTSPRDVCELLAQVDVLTPNEGELRALTGEGQPGTKTSESVAAMVQQAQAMGCRRVVVTLGSQGCHVVDGSQSFHVAGHSVQAIDATGAGDAFNGALAVALAEGRPLPEAAAWANRAAALSVQRAGAQPSLPNRSEIDAFAP